MRALVAVVLLLSLVGCATPGRPPAVTAGDVAGFAWELVMPGCLGDGPDVCDLFD